MVVNLSRGLVVGLIIVAGLGLFNVYLSVCIYKMYTQLYKKNKANERELAKCKEKMRSSHTRDGSSTTSSA